MAIIVVPDDGEKVLVDRAMRLTSVTDAADVVRLFVNDFTPTETTVTEDFTEATATGFEEKELLRSNWSAPATVDDKAEVEQSNTLFTWTNASGSPVTIYGYYVVEVGTEITVFCQRFDEPEIVNNGQSLKLTPRFHLRTDPE